MHWLTLVQWNLCSWMEQLLAVSWRFAHGCNACATCDTSCHYDIAVKAAPVPSVWLGIKLGSFLFFTGLGVWAHHKVMDNLWLIFHKICMINKYNLRNLKWKKKKIYLNVWEFHFFFWSCFILGFFFLASFKHQCNWY